ncbi:hypothetical protein C882_3653 [Caenispirillum salinarum AK4]|uniref:Glutathione S-transferase n=1 Tax=Caenispirillum salinarum AK4 TaxID=1238182 RepID=K9GZ83_9PROT|nr:glutathione S-transferase family protein [Caenispirillum salinarum]EKV31280.1 hypothetical protein C882_3653 [Caenispirillum salinarum AK4]
MILVGRNLSPYTRRVAVSLDLMEMPFERRELATATDVEAIKGYNPLGRVPALELPDGEVLIESAAILDHLDEMAGPGLRLTPVAGPARRAVMRLCAFATGAMDKAVQAYYEETRRPEDVRWPAYAARGDDQVRAGLSELEKAARTAADGGSDWLVGDRLTQADVTATVTLDFVNTVRPGLMTDGDMPALHALAERCNALPPFAKTRP